MEIWHRITYNKLDAVEHLLDKWAINCVKSPLPGDGYILTFEIAESDRRWPQIAELLRQKQTLDLYETFFTSQEIEAAEWIRLSPTFEQGYPAPKEGWELTTYADECPNCGAGYRQKAPFRLAKEPRLGKHSFMSLYWTYTIFTSQQVITALAAADIRGYERWDVLLHRTGQPSQVVSQLFFPEIAEAGLAEEDQLQPETCPQCSLTKYGYHKRGYMHYRRNALRTGVDIQLTQEWFGSGSHIGFREILISNQLARLIMENNWRGVSLKPVKLV
ncbi:MAG: hypothetical protein WA040_20945 [Anaerolineae bacterium]